MVDTNKARAAVPEEIYYARHLRLPGFTAQTQDRLRRSRVLIVGVGGLGCPAALYLAGAGVGTLALCDADDVSATNLHRQVLFDSADIGRKKVEAASARLSAMNPHIEIEAISRFADAALLDELVPKFDLVLDGTDNFSAKYAINDACEKAGVPLVYGSIFQFEGQVSVFHWPMDDQPAGLSYRDLYPDAPPAGLSQNCGEAGVVGVLPGIIGTLQANEAIKVLTGLGQPLSGQLLTFDALGACTRRLQLSRRAVRVDEVEDTGEISAEEFRRRLSSDRPPLVIDVREAGERQVASLGGEHIPLATLPAHLERLPRAGDIVVYCKSGVRSAKAALYLRSVLEGARVWSLQGGMDGAACALASTV